jgi:putative tryptophan/tyrosine transport system substrate-binding protein
VKRREFIAGLGSAAAWPVVALGQQSAMPVVGYLDAGAPGPSAAVVAAFRKGLSETGYVEGQSVAIEYRWAEGQYDRLPVLIGDLVHRQVAVIVSLGGAQAALEAKAGTTTIPIVFSLGVDPVAFGIVASLNRPGGNLTGVSTLGTELGPKRLQLLHQLRPTANLFALLVNPMGSAAVTQSGGLQAAASALGLTLHVLHASIDRDLDIAFATVTQLGAGGLVIGGDVFFDSRFEQLAALALRHAVPTIYQYRGFVEVGGLMSYGGSITDHARTVGVYVGRILKGEKPADLPVQQSTTVELMINLKTAKALGLTIPETLLATADEVIQ